MFFSGITARGSFKRQIILAFVVGFFLLVSAFAVYQVNSQKEDLYSDSSDATTGLAQSLAVSSLSWVLANDVVGLQEVVHSFQNYPELRYAMVISLSGRVLAHSDATKVGQFVADPQSLALIKAPPGIRILKNDASIADVAVPVSVNGRSVGWARVALGREDIAGDLRVMIWRNVLFVLSATLLALLAALLIANRLGSRIGALVKVADDVRAGNMATRASILGGEDEITKLADTFNQMLNALARNEERLRAASLYTRSLIEASLDPLVTINAEGKITDVNQATEAVTGRNRSELIGTDFSDYFTAPDKAREGYQQVFLRGSVTDYPLALRHRDGHVTEVLYNASVYQGENGEVLGVFAAARDITEQKRAEGARSRLAAIVESSSDAIIGKTLDGIITSWNKGAEKIYGYRADEIIGKPITTLAPSSLHAEADGLMEKVRNGEDVVNHESERIRKDGKRIYVALTLSPIKDDAGHISGISTIARDITERKRAEEALSQLTLLQRTILDNVAYGVISTNPDGIVSSFNAAAERLLGYTASDVIGQQTPACWHDPEEVARHALQLSEELGAPIAPGFEVFAARPRRNLPEENEWTFIRKDGRRFPVNLSVTALRDEGGQITGFVGLAYDLTERKRAEDAHKLNSQRVQALLQLNQMVGATLKEITDFALQEAVRLTQSKIGYLAFLNEDESVLTMHSWSKSAMAECAIDDKPFLYPVVSTGLWGEAVRQRRPIITNDYTAANPWKKGSPEGHVAIRRHMNAPVFDGARIVIVAGVGNKVEEYDEGDTQQLTLIMEAMWRLIERKRAEEVQHRLNRELRAISNCNQILMRVEDEQTLLNEICRIICDQADYRMAWVGFAENDEAKTVRPVAWAGVEDGYLAQAGITWADTERGRGPAGTTIRSGKSSCLQDFSSDPSAAPWHDSALQRGYRSCISLPLKDESQNTFGVLTIYSTEPNAFTPGEVRLLEELAGDLAFGITVLRTRNERERAEENLRRMNERYSLSTHAAGLGVWDWDLQKNELVWDERMYELYGVKREDFAGAYEAWLKGIHPDDRAASDEISKQAQRGEREYDTEFRVVWPDGSVHCLKAYGQFVRDADGKPIRMTGVNYDITESKRVASLLSQSEHEYRTLAENSPDVIVRYDRQGRRIYVNPEFERVNHLTAQQVLGKTPAELSTNLKPRADVFTEQLMAAMASGTPAEVDLSWALDGKPVCWFVRVVPEFDAGGKVTSALTIWSDISERKLAEEQLRRSEQGLAEAQRIAHLGNWDLDLATQVLTWSDEIYRIFEIDPEKFGASYDAFLNAIHPDDRELVNKAYTDSVNNKIPYDIEHRLLMKDGRVKYVNEKCETYYREDGKPLRSVGTVHDVTERKKAEDELRRYKDHLEEEVQLRTADLVLARNAAEAANRAKSVFLSSMSHELRTPLNAILGFSSMMRKDPLLQAEQRQNLDIINRSGEHLLTLINDVLEMAKIEAGRVQVESLPFDLGSLVRDVTDMMHVRAQEKGLQLLIDQSSEFPRYVKGDEARVRQVLINLLGNAVKFTRQGGVTVRFGLKPHATPQRMLIEVEDSGIGISAADQKRVFEPFVQFGETAAQQGTGLGLSIARQFVQLMGGAISFESMLGKGSTFRVELPMERVASADVAKPESTVKGEIVGLAPGQPEYRILIVEDQLDNQLLLSKLMKNVGFQAKVAENGEQAVGLFQSWRPQLIWMDRRMPVMDGLEATRRIRELPGGREVKIVAVTASAFTEQREEMLKAGMDDFVRKPYRFNEIYECMTKQLGVQYTYAEAQDAQEVSDLVLTAEMLAVLPPDLHRELHDAMESLEGERITAVIGQVASFDSKLHKTLSRLADNFDYPAILKALQTNPPVTVT